MIPNHINTTVRDQYARHPKLRPRVTALNIITLFFLFSPAVYFGLAYSGLVGRAPEEIQPSGDAFPIWWVLAGVALAMIPAAFLMGTMFLKQVHSAATFGAAWEKCNVMIIVVLALGEAITIYGLIGGFMGMPETVRYSLMGLGVGVMLMLLATFRRAGLDQVLLKLIEEEKEAGLSHSR